MADWQVCEAPLHEGDEHDDTVAWRELGLLCDTCDAAITDERPLKAEIARLRALTVDDPETIYHEHEKLRLAIVAHRERWTSVNSGDIKLNARPADLELWEVLDA